MRVHDVILNDAPDQAAFTGWRRSGRGLEFALSLNSPPSPSLRYLIGWEWRAAAEVLREGPLNAKVGVEVTELPERRANKAARQIACGAAQPRCAMVPIAPLPAEPETA